MPASLDLIDAVRAARTGDAPALRSLVEATDWVVRAVGGEPGRTTALGAGFGLERIAALRYGIDDLRKMGTARVP